MLVRYADETKKPNSDRLREFSDSQLAVVKNELSSPNPINDEYEAMRLTHGLTKLREVLGTDHPIVKKVLGQRAPEELAADLVKKTKLKDAKARKKLLDGGEA